MYDTIFCKYPLPMPDDPKGYTSSYDFQTKDLDLALELYSIDENGQLFLHLSEGEWVEGNKDSESLIGRLGYFKTTRKWLEEKIITATVTFYDYQQSNNTDYDYFIEYEAIFVDGKITSVKLIKFEANDNADRKKRDVEFKEQLKEWQDFSQSKRYKYFFKPYSSAIRFICKNIGKILDFSRRNLYKVEKFLLFK